MFARPGIHLSVNTKINETHLSYNSQFEHLGPRLFPPVPSLAPALSIEADVSKLRHYLLSEMHT